ncbi:Hypothetical protein EIN_091820, partial [Entamoeba invadens IP1]
MGLLTIFFIVNTFKTSFLLILLSTPLAQVTQKKRILIWKKLLTRWSTMIWR